ncbi:DUF4307 domain-containing protein [Agrococcus sp. ARC_14]|uniref:DUF4307 domain-containing protein n=1 Tax=Agrococcus sp. ARC_14 TaxID=2919927 RepID=UPI001F052CE0|nr:DUF4307 domain-containing protein [Agrococcus sp. ARC_14]MCH1882400.1 DUF4307 domain-containing protein [Agrococcus sp. ARC_14]
MTDLEARYGRTRSRTRREKILGIAVGVAILLAATMWVWWVGTDPASTQLQTRTIGHEIVDDASVEVIFEVSVDAGTPVECAVEALNQAYGIVGWVQLELPPAEAFTSTHVVDVRTSELATTGLVSECWVP